MKTVFLVVAALSVASSSMMSSSYNPYKTLFKYGMMPKQRFMGDDTEDFSMMGTSGLCNNLCKRQMMPQWTSEQMGQDTMEMLQQQQMVPLMVKMEEIMQQTGPMMSMEGKISQVVTMAEQFTEMFRELIETRMKLYFDEIKKSGYMMMATGSLPSGMLSIVKEKAMEFLTETNMKMQREDIEGMNQIKDVLSAAIMSQMVMQQSSPMVDKDFLFEVQDMLQSIDMWETQRMLTEFAIRAEQVQIKMKLLEQQKRMIQMFPMMMMRTTETPEVMEQTRQEIKETLEELTVTQMAYDMVINAMQRMLMSQRNMMQKLKMEQLAFEPMSMSMNMMMMPKMMGV